MTSRKRPPCRVILLLDLDCFYAQCERVRLGLDDESCSLALLQWNSVLAVTYPARKFGIRRGDNWEAVAEKSNGACLAIHLPLLKTGETRSEAQVDPSLSIDDAYDQIFRLSEHERKDIMQREGGRRRNNAEGKACLERYRLASTRIFGVVLGALREKVGRENFVLERASIDELFVDVTRYCWSTDDQRPTLGFVAAVDKTAKVELSLSPQQYSPDDPEITLALNRGCYVAKQIRQAVFDELGFTLSAGISTSKLVAKLGASYGKPNGQAVVYPSCIPAVMAKTPIRKVRNLGGKTGKRVCGLLGSDPEKHTMGTLAASLSLPALTQALGPETGQMVFDAARGQDQEVVAATKDVLVKSITAFKSFPMVSLTSGELLQWLELLATDLVARVEQDLNRNDRYPKSCTIHYSQPSASGKRLRSVFGAKSLRIPFPKDSTADKKTALVTKVKETLVVKEGVIKLTRIGLAATDFEPRNGGIAQFLTPTTDTKNPRQPIAELEGPKPEAASNAASLTINAKRSWTSSKSACANLDLELARKLQAKYDREDRMHALLDQRQKQRRLASNASDANKRVRIDSFFTTKSRK